MLMDAEFGKTESACQTYLFDARPNSVRVRLPMHRTFSFFVAGTPKPQPRPRAFAFKRGDKTQVRVYDPGSSEHWKSEIALAAKEAGITKIDGPVGLKLVFSFPRPKAHFRANGCVKDSAPKFHTKKPDFDNLAAAVSNALTKIGAWEDDAQVVSCRVEKHWALGNWQGGCSVEITSMT